MDSDAALPPSAELPEQPGGGYESAAEPAASPAEEAADAPFDVDAAVADDTDAAAAHETHDAAAPAADSAASVEAAAAGASSSSGSSAAGAAPPVAAAEEPVTVDAALPQQQQQQQQTSSPMHRSRVGSRSSSGSHGRSRVGEAPPSPPLQQPHQHQPHQQQPASVAAAVPEPCTSSQQPLQAPLYMRASGSSMLSLHIHRSSQLQPDLLLTDPVIRLHVVHAATGEYVRLVHQLADPQQQQQQQQQQVGAGSSSSGGSGAFCTRHVVSSDQQAELLDYPGRPSLATLDNNTRNPKAALLEHLPPLQTRPHNIGDSSSSRGGSSSSATQQLAAAWDEELCVDVPPEALAASDALLLLEIVQLPGGFERYKRHAAEFSAAGKGHPVAWACLRLSGLEQQQQLGQQPLKLRLQLYRYRPGTMGARHEGCLSLGRAASPHPESAAKAAYLSFRHSGFYDESSPLAHMLAQPPAAGGGFPGSRSSSPWPALPGGFGRSAAEAAAHVQKYPSYLEVTLAAVPRPPAAVVVTDPAAGMRPVLPAGFGSGYEIGRMPVSLLYMPRAVNGGRSSSCADDASLAAAGDAVLDNEVLLLESRLHRPHTQPCQLPNAVLSDIKGTAGGCSCISISRDGRWLAAACSNERGAFRVVLYHALTGRLRWVLGSHAGFVYSISWARDDSSLVTASADFTAKVWHLPELPAPAVPSAAACNLHAARSSRQHSRQQRQGSNQASNSGSGWGASGEPFAGAAVSSWGAAGDVDSSSMGGTSAFAALTLSSGATATTAAAAAAGVIVAVLQHTCYVYAAEQHPMLQSAGATVVTAGFDGIVRLWSCKGVVLHSLQVSAVPINCLAFDQLGARCFVGDAAGVVTELSLDLTPLTAVWAAAGAAALSSHSALATAAGDGSTSSPGSSPGTSLRRAGLSGSGGSPLRHASGAAAGGGSDPPQLLKKLRSSQELAGCPILHLACHPGGHHLMAFAKSAKGCSDVVALDAKLLLVARRFGGVRCSSAPLKFSLSPDGQFVLCGSEDGSAVLWDFATATATPLPHMALGGEPIYCMAWSSCFQAVVVCSFRPYAPIRVLGFSTEQPHVVLNPPEAAGAAARSGSFSHSSSMQAHSEAAALAELITRPLRCPLPDSLTPSHVHALLTDLRTSAQQRGLYCQADPNGEHLMVVHKRTQRRLGSHNPGSGSLPGSGRDASEGLSIRAHRTSPVQA